MVRVSANPEENVCLINNRPIRFWWNQEALYECLSIRVVNGRTAHLPPYSSKILSLRQAYITLPRTKPSIRMLALMLDNMLFWAQTDPASALRHRQELDAADEMEHMADYFEGLAADVGITTNAHGC